MDSRTDNALMRQVQSGDLRKMGVLYERYRGKLFGYFYQINGDPRQSEDLVHSVFVRLIDYRHTFSESGSFASWIFRTARNLQFDHFRKQARNPIRYGQEAGEVLQKPAENAADEDKEADLKRLRRALDLLPVEQREILVLSKIKGLTFKEIGIVLDCTDGAAKVRAHRALKALRREMIVSK